MVFFFYFFPPIFSILILGKRAESGQNKNRKDGWGIYFFSMVWITNQQTNNPRFVIQAMDKEKKYSHQQDKQKIQITKQAWVICIFVCRWCPYFPPIINRSFYLGLIMVAREAPNYNKQAKRSVSLFVIVWGASLIYLPRQPLQTTLLSLFVCSGWRGRETTKEPPKDE